MSTLTLTGVGYDLPDSTLFDDVNLRLDRGDRVALVGDNGAGKTTLLSLAAGSLEPDRGCVTARGRVAYLPQHLPLVPEVPGSGGEIQRQRLVELLTDLPDLVLLDEPTHHLDADAMAWLEDHLLSTARDAAVLFVSHDRAFLDAVATHVAFLERGALRVEAGNYTAATQRRQAQDEATARRHHAQARDRARLRAEAGRQHSKARSAGAFDKRRAEGQPLLLAKNKAENVSNTLARRARSIAARLEREDVIKKPWQDRRRLEFVAEPSTSGPTEVITAEGLVVRRGALTIVPNLDLYVRRGERIALVGPNGSGKSTTLDVLRGARAPDGGSVRHGVGLRIARTDQTGEPWAGSLGAAGTVGGVLRDANPALSDTDVWRVTASVGVPSGPDRPLSDLSGGERRRLTLARIAVTDAHLLVLDEPTHHLDLRAVEALESLLGSFTGTLLFATHDRRLVERLATSVWRFGEGGLEPESVTPGQPSSMLRQ